MNLPDEAPKLNPWPFIAADVTLLAVAFWIGSTQPAPLSGGALIVVACLAFAGSVIAVVPFLLRYTRQQEHILNERQQEIAALAQTTAASAEQLSIAAASLHTIAESAAKSVRHAEQLPQKLQEKIHEFKEQLNEVALTENEALSQEVNTLRSSETERMESLVTTVRKLSSEFARLEAASRKNVNELTESLSKFTISAEQAASEAATTVASARAGAEKSLSEAHARALAAIESGLSLALADLDSKLSAVAGRITAQVDHAAQTLDERIASLQVAVSQPLKSQAFDDERTTQPHQDSASNRPLAPTESTVAASAPTTASYRSASEESISQNGPEAGEPAASHADAVALSPTPEGSDSTSPVQNVRAVDADNTASNAEPVDAAGVEKVDGNTSEAGVRALRKRSARRPEADNELSLGLELPPNSSDAGSSSAVSSDGLTRLVVTAYIGLGNKLFVRGEGPGLSWEKGTPLQFISIGKWRWETADASAPVRAKILKNDEVECTALGEISLEPGHQREVDAKF